MGMSKFDLACLVVGAVAWIIELGAVSAISAFDGVAQSTVSLAWWALWWQFFLYILSFVVLIGVWNAARLRTHMWLMVTVVWMIVAWTYNQTLDGLNNGNAYHSRAAAGLAGAILILIVNMIQIIYWGLTEDGTMPMSLRAHRDSNNAPAPASPGSTTTTVSQRVDYTPSKVKMIPVSQPATPVPITPV